MNVEELVIKSEIESKGNLLIKHKKISLTPMDMSTTKDKLSRKIRGTVQVENKDGKKSKTKWTFTRRYLYTKDGALKGTETYIMAGKERLTINETYSGEHQRKAFVEKIIGNRYVREENVEINVAGFILEY